MRPTLLFTIVLRLIYLGNLNAQTAIPAKPEKWTTYSSKAEFINDSIHLINLSDTSALLWLNNTNFRNGIIELDIKGKDIRGQSFLGVAFHGSNNQHYDAVYFRPFNFKDPERKDHSVQYISKPNYDWEVLREKYPLKYEHSVQPVPNPTDWFHAKIEILFPNIKVYVNGSKQASLEIKQISERKSGKLGLWIDSKDGWFRNLVITGSK